MHESKASLVPELVVTIGGTSKLLVPGLRTAFLAGAPARTARLAEMVWASTWMASPLGAEIAAGWIEDGSADRVVDARREEMRVRSELARKLLGGLRFHTRPGSHHLWLELPEGIEAAGYTAAMLQRGVAVLPAEVFLSAPAPAPRAVRISLSAPRDLATLRRALELVAEVAQGRGDGVAVRL